MSPSGHSEHFVSSHTRNVPVFPSDPVKYWGKTPPSLVSHQHYEAYSRVTSSPKQPQNSPPPKLTQLSSLDQNRIKLHPRKPGIGYLPSTGLPKTYDLYNIAALLENIKGLETLLKVRTLMIPMCVNKP